MTAACKWTRALALLVLLAGGAARAQDAAPGDDALAALLIAHDVVYAGIAWERHEANGALLYRSAEGPVARTSLGQWRIEDGRRCLRWTRAMPWACYVVAREGAGRILFTDAEGNVSTGRLVSR